MTVGITRMRENIYLVAEELIKKIAASPINHLLEMKFICANGDKLSSLRTYDN